MVGQQGSTAMSRASKEKARRQLARQLREVAASGHSKPTREAAAWHEAAHGVTAEYFDLTVDFVTCDPFMHKGQMYLGYCMGAELGPERVGSARALYGLMQAVAGFVCEWRRGSMDRSYGDPGDLHGVREIMDELGFAEKEFEIFCGCTEEFLEWAWDVVESVATHLLVNGRMEGDALRELVRTRLGYIPKDKHQKLFQGVVTRPGSEAATREPWLLPKAEV
jgi:hypothetical protein